MPKLAFLDTNTEPPGLNQNPSWDAPPLLIRERKLVESQSRRCYNRLVISAGSRGLISRTQCVVRSAELFNRANDAIFNQIDTEYEKELERSNGRWGLNISSLDELIDASTAHGDWYEPRKLELARELRTSAQWIGGGKSIYAACQVEKIVNNVGTRVSKTVCTMAVPQNETERG